jgi:cell division protein FtsL
MIIRALNTIGLVAAVVLAFALYRAKTEAHAARERLDALTVLVEEERQASNTLRAEIAFLERPERLRALAARHLGLEPTDPTRELTLEQTLLALGAPDPNAPRYAEAAPAAGEPDASAVAMAEAAPAMEDAAPVALAETGAAAPAPMTEPAATQLAQAEIEAAPLAPVSSPAPAPLREVEDPIASLIIAAGGMR